MFARSIIDIKNNKISPTKFSQNVGLIIASQAAVAGLKTLAGALYFRRDPEDNDEYFWRTLIATMMSFGGRGPELIVDVWNAAKSYGWSVQDPFMGVLSDAAEAAVDTTKSVNYLKAGEPEKAKKAIRRSVKKGVRTGGVASGTGAQNIIEPAMAILKHATR